MFRGVSALNLDAKGRLAIPTKYRDPLLNQCDGRLVVTVNHSERCLWMYPLQEWDEIEKKVVALPSLDAAAQRLKRILIGHASDCELDRNGRVLLSGPLREFADLEKRVVLIGQGNKFEIWNDLLWAARRDEWLSHDHNNGPLSIELESLSL
ncbi:MAG: division/cell wall cluster transcriptional repressor MraZ [Gammaproteobacteria bacterium]|nr:division/cell wall cluster transcriptional repressor MraZ [Gammaproteobacteria bacterium]